MIDLDKMYDVAVNFAEANEIIEALARFQSISFYVEPQNKGMTRIWVTQDHADILEHLLRTYNENLYLKGETFCPFCREKDEPARLEYTNVDPGGCDITLGKQCVTCNNVWDDEHSIGKEFSIYYNRGE